MTTSTTNHDSPGRVLLGYRFGPAVIDLDADDLEAARWLTEFLAPWFEVCDPGNGQVIVRLTSA